MMRTVRFFVLVSLAFLGSVAYAHHSFQATFKPDAKIDVEGVVTKFSFRNPHIIINLDVTNADGSVTNWMSEGAAATLMRRAGWARDAVKPGDVIRVHGDSTHDGSPMVSIDSVDVLDPNTRAVVRTLNRQGGGAEEPPTVKAAAMPLTFDGGKPNVTGAWTNHGMRSGRPGPPNMTLNELGASVQKSYNNANDPQIFCDAPGLVRQLNTPHPIRITQSEDRVIIEYEEYAGRREIKFSSDLPEAGLKTHFGDSVARYEGDALVIETVNLLGNPTNPNGDQLSDQTTTLERYTRADSDEFGPTISIHVTVSDPEYLVEDGSISRDKMSAGVYEFIENDCQQPLRERLAVNPAASFFLTSHGPGNGANLGGLEGADQYCADLAATVGAGDKDWRAYLSTTGREIESEPALGTTFGVN